MRKVLGVIPARLESSRLPHKLLIRVGGKSILQHTYEQAIQARRLDKVVIASGDPEIIREAMRFGCRTAVFTDESKAPIHSGTMRVGRVSEMPQFNDYDIFVNIQADEPEVRPEDIDLLVNRLGHSSLINTLVSELEPGENDSESVVKAQRTLSGKSVFYRSDPPIYGTLGSPLKHIGVYAFKRSALPFCHTNGPVDLEQQFFGNIAIGLIPTRRAVSGINTREDLLAFTARYEEATLSEAY